MTNCALFLHLSLIAQVEFRRAAVDVKSKLKVRPADDELLILYGLFKQGLQGDNTTSKFEIKGLRTAHYLTFSSI